MEFTNIISEIRAKKPLVHNITNMVVMNFNANVLLSLGASPVMAHAIEEIPDMVSLASSLVINIGTLDSRWISSMLLAIEEASKKNVPIIFDPVGSGATKFRTEMAKKIIAEGRPSIIRGNASEIMSLVDKSISTKGVDSSHSSSSAKDAALKISKDYSCTVVVSGEKDLVVTGDKISEISNGVPIMTKVTGVGCASTAIIGACAAINKDSHLAAVSGMCITGITGENASYTKTPGTFAVNFIDQLSLIDDEMLLKQAKVKDL